MSGAVKSIGKKLFGGDDTRQAFAAEESRQQAAAEAPQPAARSASEGEKAMALRRRRGTRSLLSQERIDAESGLGGDQTTLGG